MLKLRSKKSSAYIKMHFILQLNLYAKNWIEDEKWNIAK